MKVLYVTSEAHPFAATGGLADVSGSLPQALKQAGVDIRVVMPLYKTVIDKFEADLQFVEKTYVTLAWREQYCGVFTMKSGGVTYYFIDNKFYFDRNELYGHYDDGERFAFFCKAVFKLIELTGFRPNIIHANDWQAALVAIYLDLAKKQATMLDIKSIFTIHNINYQGQYDPAILGDVFDIENQYYDIVEYNNCINLMKGAIVCADLISTVSPRYAREITTARYASGLDYIINANRHKLVGILNGLDVQIYNSERDETLHKNFTLETIVAGKKANKKYLQKALGLDIDDKVPLLAVISRLSPLKGIDLIIDRFHEIMQKDVQFVILGTGESYYKHKFEQFARQYPGRVAAVIAWDSKLSRQIYAACDIFLMPSKTEPCGLSQMIACRYGAVPLVRATGGLYDSINDDNGFVFKHYDSWEMLKTINEAVELFENRRDFNKKMRNAYNSDFSWDKSAQEYLVQYEKLKE